MTTICPLDIRDVARALGGEVIGAQVSAPGPGHRRRDRSLSVRLSPTSSDGFLVDSHAGDGWQVWRDYVRERLGLTREPYRRHAPQRLEAAAMDRDTETDSRRTIAALDVWRQGVALEGTLAERYFAGRGLNLGADIASDTVRWHQRLGAVVALFRNIKTGEPQAVTRIFLDREGCKRERKFLGSVGGAAVMLDPFDAVAGGLHIGEGVETCMAARQLGLRPTWAPGSCGAIAGFPILSGVDCPTILTESDEAAAQAAEDCATRWHASGREVLINRPIGGKERGLTFAPFTTEPFSPARTCSYRRG
jgi:putative DNA primase/helicase